MTRGSSLRKIVEASGFASQMRELEFELGPSHVWFYRLRGDFIDWFGFWPKSSGRWADVPVVCLKYDLVSHCDMSTFPRGFQNGIPVWTGAFTHA